MNCPACDLPTRVLSTRHGTQRRRECPNGHRFTTEEIPVQDLDELHDAVGQVADFRRFIENEMPIGR